VATSKPQMLPHAYSDKNNHYQRKESEIRLLVTLSTSQPPVWQYHPLSQCTNVTSRNSHLTTASLPYWHCQWLIKKCKRKLYYECKVNTKMLHIC